MIPFSRIKRNGKVDLWDLGPKRPEPPPEPAKPDASLKGPDKAAAEIEYEDAYELYKQKLRDFGDAKRAHLAWHDQKGGPFKIELWGIDARHALEIAPDRYKLDLPRGTKPGKAQVEAEQQAEAERTTLEKAIESDPQFGQGARP